MGSTRTGSALGHRGRWSALVLGALLTFSAAGLCQPKPSSRPEALAHGFPGPSGWPSGLDEWRAEVARVRQLADNNAPRAYQEAQHLQATIPAGATPSDHARALNLLSRVETYLGLTELAAKHAHDAFDLAAANGDRVGQAQSDLNVALNSINQGRLDEMVTATQNAVTTLEGVNRPDLLGEALLRSTAMYRRFEQYDESVAVAVQAMDMARRSKNPLALTYAHQGLAIAYDQSYRFAEAREQYAQMRSAAQAAHDRLLEGFAVTGLASWNSETGNLPAAEQLTREAIEMFREIGVPFARSYGLYGLADLLAKQGRQREALQALDEALGIYQQLPNRISEWYALNARSADYQALGDLRKASEDAERAYALAKSLDLPLYLSGSATRRAAIAAAQGDYERAYALSLEASEMTAKAARDKAGPRLVQLISRYESENKQHEIDQLTRRSERQSAQLLERELQQRLLWTVLTGVIIALGIVGVFVFRLRKSKQQLQALNLQLRHSEGAIRALNADLEQRVQARTQELRQQARYLRTLIDTLPMWAWLKDTQSRYLVVNHAHAAARGYSVAEMEGQSDQQLLPPIMAQQQLTDDREVMESRQRKSTEECLTDDSGGVWKETYKAAVLDEDGTVLGTVGVAWDISERKAAEAAREVALSEARRLARQRSQFLAQMSHELRTPLNAMMGFAQILQRDKSLPERAGKAVRIIEESGQHLLRLINDILDLARIDAGKLELSNTEIHLRSFLQIVCDTIQVRAEDKGLQFVFVAAPDLPDTVFVDEKRLRQVLLNLLSNAVKFSDSGQVVLRVTREKPADEATAAADTVRLRFAVEDQGIGMSEREQARAFQPFEQVADARRREGGAGLGLAISRQLVHLMGGEIRVQSRLGEGSVFSFELDVLVTETPAAAVTGTQMPVGYLGERRRILIADDVPENRAVLVAMLSALDFRVIEVTNGWETLKEVTRVAPDLAIVDLAMPIMDGWETIRRLRQMPEGSKLPVIATSASATADIEASSRAAGANTFVGKPIQEAVLLQAIGALLELEWTYQSPARQA
jgi:PAS domain S-box-containing protein